MAEKKKPYSYTAPKNWKKPVKIKKLPVQQQIVHQRKRHRHAQQDSDNLTREEKYAAVVIILVFLVSVAYLFTR